MARPPPPDARRTATTKTMRAPCDRAASEPVGEGPGKGLDRARARPPKENGALEVGGAEGSSSPCDDQAVEKGRRREGAQNLKVDGTAARQADRGRAPSPKARRAGAAGRGKRPATGGASFHAARRTVEQGSEPRGRDQDKDGRRCAARARVPGAGRGSRPTPNSPGRAESRKGAEPTQRQEQGPRLGRTAREENSEAGNSGEQPHPTRAARRPVAGAVRQPRPALERARATAAEEGDQRRDEESRAKTVPRRRDSVPGAPWSQGLALEAGKKPGSRLAAGRVAVLARSARVDGGPSAITGSAEHLADVAKSFFRGQRLAGVGAPGATQKFVGTHGSAGLGPRGWRKTPTRSGATRAAAQGHCLGSSRGPRAGQCGGGAGLWFRGRPRERGHGYRPAGRDAWTGPADWQSGGDRAVAGMGRAYALVAAQELGATVRAGLRI